MRTRSLLLAAILVFCVVGRGAYALYLVHSGEVVTTVGDAPSYLGPARELLHHGRFDAANPPGQPEFLRTPGYPAFIAAVYRVFGETNTAVLLVQVVLSALTVFLVYLLASTMWSASIGLLAALFTALEPLQSVTSATLLTECVAALLLTITAAVGFAVLRRDKPRPGLLAVLGLVMAVSILVRPVLYYLPLLVLLLLVIRYAGRRGQWVALAKATAAFLVPLVVLVGGWQLRNHERVDSWRVSGIEGKNLYKYRAAGVLARTSGVSLIDAQHELSRKFGPLGTESQGSYYGRMYRAGMHILTSHPGDAIIGAVDGFWNELFSVHHLIVKSLHIRRVAGAVEFAAVALLLAFYAVCVYGMVLVVRRRRDLLAHVFVVGVAFYVLLASAGPEALGGRGERFRAPIMPLLILYAASGVYALRTSAVGRRVDGTREADDGRVVGDTKLG